MSPSSSPAVLTAAFRRIAANGEATELTRAVADEVPVAISVNGVGYAVLMATPLDVEDLVYGFLLAERLIAGADDVTDLDCQRIEAGVIARASVAGASAEALVERIRHRATDSSCGLCGVENLEQVMRDLPQARQPCAADDAALFRALADLGDHQPLNRLTGGVHAAALCASDGAVRLAREDIGRHNAFDKLIGAMLRQGLDWQGGFALLSSRCSYELVEKAALSGCPLLATISAPTALALRRAAEAALPLRVLARSDAVLAPAPHPG